MPIRTTVVGSYPKVTEDMSDYLPGAIEKWQRGQMDDQALEAEFQRVIRRVIAEQENAGLDLITDGQIRWEDLPHGICRSVRGIHRGALRRFFDNNVYYRRLELDSEVRWTHGAVAEEWLFASRIARQDVKAVLPGPMTLVASTEIGPTQNPEDLLTIYTEILRKEVEALEQAGAKVIQLDEPAWDGDELKLEQAIASVNRIFRGVRAQRWVAIYFKNPIPILSRLAEFPLDVDGLSLDLVSHMGKVKGFLSCVAKALEAMRWTGEVALGIVDARDTRLESLDELRQRIEPMASVVPIERLWISPNCGLEFLPHRSAQRKLKVLKEAAQCL
jgi:5-methyltetrahydropteroyltriglutamate--homocysteine methyltransferase